MKQLTSITIVLFAAFSSFAQNDVCKMPLSSVWVKMDKEVGYESQLKGDGLANYLDLVQSSTYVYLYYKKSTGWKMVKECQIPKMYLKSFYYKPGVQYGFSVKLAELPILLTLSQ